MSSSDSAAQTPVGKAPKAWRAQASTTLKKGLRNVGLTLAGVREDVDANADAREKLLEHARFIQQKMQSIEDTEDVNLGDLKAVLADIFEFEKKLGKTSEAVRSMAAVNEHRAEIVSYRERLEHTWSLVQADMVHGVRETLQKLQLTERPQMPSAPIPIDQLSAILPGNVDIYVGHEDELEALVAILLEVLSAHVIIDGGGGMGKTALASKGMWDPRVESKFANRRFFMNCDGIVSAEGIVAALASVFHLTESPGTTMQQALLAHLRSLRVCTLIVLDNLESSWDTDDQPAVEAFLSNLCSIDLIAVVVTMRGTSPPQGPRWHRRMTLQPLDTPDAHALFTQLYPESAAHDEERSLRELLGLVDGLPLAITLLAMVGLTGYTPSDLLAAYRDERTVMVKRGRGDDRSSNLDISILLSMNCQTMQNNPDALRLLELLALLPDGLIEDDRTEVLPSMTQFPAAARVLVQVALCTRNNGTCRVLAPIREYVEKYHPPSGPHLEELREYYFHAGRRGADWGKEPHAVRNEVAQKVGNILAILRHAMGTTADGQKVLSALLGVTAFSIATSSGDCVPTLQLAFSTYQSICRTQTNMHWLLAACKLHLGRLMQSQANSPGATAALNEAKAAFEDIGDRLEAAHCTKSLGDIMRMQNDYHGATAALNEAKAACEDIGNRLGAANCTESLGDTMRMQGDYHGATAALNEAKSAFKDIGDRLGAANCTKSLGDIMQMQDDYHGATAALNEAKSAYKGIGDRLGAANCTQSLGDIMRMQGDDHGATAALNEAKSAFKDIGDSLGAANCMQSLGEIMRMQHDYHGATAALNEAKAAYEDMGNRLGAAHCMQSLGEIMRMQHDYHGATAALNEAKSAYEDIGDRLGAAHCTNSLGEIMRMQGDYHGATAALNEAKSAFKDIGDRLGAANCTKSLGDIMQMQHDYHGATAALNEAKSAFKDIGDRLGAANCMQSLGDIMRMQHDYHGATAALNEAKSAYEGIGNRLGAANCTQSLGDTMRMQGDYDGATAALNEAKSAFKDIGNRLGAANCTKSLGDTMRMQDDYDGATAALNEAKAVYEGIGDRLGAANCTQSLGEIMRMQHDYQGASAALNKAKAIYDDIGDRLLSATCILGLGLIMAEQGNTEGTRAALIEAKARFDEIGNPLFSARCQHVLDLLARRSWWWWYLLEGAKILARVFLPAHPGPSPSETET